jgi:hypothetical protein
VLSLIPLDELDVHRLVNGEVPTGWVEYLKSEYPNNPAMWWKVQRDTIALALQNSKNIEQQDRRQELMEKLLVTMGERNLEAQEFVYTSAVAAEEARDEAYALSIQTERDEGWWAAYCNLWKRHPLPMLAGHALAVYAAYKVGTWVARLGAYVASTAALQNEVSRLNGEIEASNRQLAALQAAPPPPEPVELVREVHHHPVTMEIADSALAGSMGVLMDALAADGRFQGARGRTGPAGPRGKPGKPGKAGRDGRAGRDGKAGKRGAAGRDGKAGRAGRDGRDGAAGRDGRDGKDGWNVAKTTKANSAAAMINTLKELENA